jgi:hypothetical protein
MGIRENADLIVQGIVSCSIYGGLKYDAEIRRNNARLILISRL